MASPEISVIIPIYKVEKYIEKCLESVRRQTFGDFEALLINDGTPDGSMEIAERFAADDPRFKIFNKENGGLSSARNYGLERAAGRYIAFIDSDDFVHKKYLETLYLACEKSGADMAGCQYLFSFAGGKIRLPWPFAPRPRTLSAGRAMKMIITDVFLQSMAWNKLYRRELFTETGIRYPDMAFEDVATSERLLFRADRFVLTGKVRYYYTSRGGSILHTRNAKLVNDFARSLLIIRAHLEKNGVFPEYRRYLARAVGKMKLSNAYVIFTNHLSRFDFRGFGKNMKTLGAMGKYILSDSPDLGGEFPEMPMAVSFDRRGDGK